MNRRNSVLFHNTGVVANTASTTVTSRNTTLPSNPRLGQITVLATDASTEDIVYMRIQNSSGVNVWVEIGRAS